jgi:hypothetical protein
VNLYELQERVEHLIEHGHGLNQFTVTDHIGVGVVYDLSIRENEDGNEPDTVEAWWE